MADRRRRPRLACALGFALALLATATACREAVQRIFATPTVAVRGARLESLDLAGGRLLVALAIANPNPYSLTATGARYRVLAGDSTEIGRGESATGVTVGAHDSATVELPIDLRWDAVTRAGRTGARRGALDYRVLGTITASTPIGPHDFPLDGHGRVKLPALFR